jgi:hypothetical protein
MKPSLASKWKPSGVTWMNADKRTRGMLTNAWTAGELSWKLNPNQLGVYRELRAWEKDKDRGHLYALDISRRWGKSTLMVTMAFEDAIRNGGWRIVYCAPTNVMVKKILLPLVTILLQDCPEDLKPEYQRATLRIQERQHHRACGHGREPGPCAWNVHGPRVPRRVCVLRQP